MSNGSSRSVRSALYEGTVAHRRAEPAHRFSNRVAMPLLFLDELPDLGRVHPLVDLDPTPHRRRRAVMRFDRNDFLPSNAPTLEDAVVEAVADAGGAVRGPVAMLGHLRTWGWLFNPLTLYYCFDPSGIHVEWTVLEVSNTPWKERQHYVVGSPGEHRFAKAMHVSPFLPPEGRYTLRYTAPAETLRATLDVEAARPYLREHETNTCPPAPQLTASMLLRRRPLDRAALGHLLWGYPLMTARVSGGIYAQALRLGARRATFHQHPGPPSAEPVRVGAAGPVAEGGCPVRPR